MDKSNPFGGARPKSSVKTSREKKKVVVGVGSKYAQKVVSTSKTRYDRDTGGTNRVNPFAAIVDDVAMVEQCESAAAEVEVAGDVYCDGYGDNFDDEWPPAPRSSNQKVDPASAYKSTNPFADIIDMSPPLSDGMRSEGDTEITPSEKYITGHSTFVFKTRSIKSDFEDFPCVIDEDPTFVGTEQDKSLHNFPKSSVKQKKPKWKHVPVELTLKGEKGTWKDQRPPRWKDTVARPLEVYSRPRASDDEGAGNSAHEKRRRSPAQIPGDITDHCFDSTLATAREEPPKRPHPELRRLANVALTPRKRSNGGERKFVSYDKMQGMNVQIQETPADLEEGKEAHGKKEVKSRSKAQINKQKSRGVFDEMTTKHKRFFSKQVLYNDGGASLNELKNLFGYIMEAEADADKGQRRHQFLIRLLNTKFLNATGPVVTFITDLVMKRLPNFTCSTISEIDEHYGSILSAIVTLLDEILTRIPHISAGCVSGTMAWLCRIPDYEKSSFAETMSTLNKGLADPHLLANKVSDPTYNWSQDFSFIGEKTIPPLEVLLSGNLPKKFTNLIDRPYGDSKKYIEIWFKLMREDFLSPLRTAVREFKSLSGREKANRKRVNDGYLYRFSKDAVFKNSEGRLLIRLDFREFRKEKLRDVDWATTDRLRGDSLLLLSTDNFKTAEYCLIQSRDNEEKRKGFVWVRAVDNQGVRFDKDVQGLEPTPFWEPYRCVLERLKLQAANIERGGALPMERYLVGLDKNVRYPPYLSEGEALQTRKEALILLGNEDAMSVLDMDESQQAALELALTHELAVIQGPPGTGKSYVGAHLVDLLLLNKRLWQRYDKGCILLMSFTNHAIDQFVNECEKMGMDMESTVRLGSRGDDSMKKFLLKNRWNEISQMNEYGGIQRPSIRIRNEKRAYDETIVEAEGAMVQDWTKVTFECYSEFISERSLHEFTNAFGTLRHEHILEWLTFNNTVNLDLKNVEPLSRSEAQHVHNVLHIGENKRARLFVYWCLAAKTDAEQFLLEAIQRREQLQTRMDEQRRKQDVAVIQKADIIATTTTGASKHAHLLEEVQPTIVVVEEAAEVLESHIVAPLTAGCQHLILIGDHEQLRPNISEFRLIREKRNLEVSLFERLVKNDIPNKCLKVQHRMHPDISRILYPHIYDELDDHPDVLEYPKVRGMRTRMTLIEHRNPEAKIGENSSYTNLHEAKFVVALCRYLLRQGYLPSEITILTTYIGQRRLIRSLIMTGLAEIHQDIDDDEEDEIDFADFRDDEIGEEEQSADPSMRLYEESMLTEVKVTTVDNYQGEENKIILLSFVRSNEIEKIGFLQWSNRVCVALSRAKHGFYALGNYLMYAWHSEIWKKLIEQVAEDPDCFSATVEIECERHGITHQVMDAESLTAVSPEGGCSRNCESRLECGHSCKRFCHPDDSQHIHYQCMVPCPGQLDCGHLCDRPCSMLGDDQNFQEMQEMSKDTNSGRLRICSMCSKAVVCRIDVPVDPPCGHQGITPCTDVHRYACQVVVPTTLPCSHNTEAECSADVTSIKCKNMIVDCLACGHDVRRQCFRKNSPCTEIVSKKFDHCGHTKEIECGRWDLEVDCDVQVPVSMPCRHPRSVPCYKSKLQPKCITLIRVRKECGEHFKDVLCCDKDEPDSRPCDDMVERYFDDCTHFYKAKCCEPKRKKCVMTVSFERKCGHFLRGPCHDTVLAKAERCAISVRKYRPCGHWVNVPCFRSKDELKGRCKRTCSRKCSHGTPCTKLMDPEQKQSKRKHLCGDVCPPCTRPCPLRCIHTACSRQCHADCTRNPCDKRCTRTLACSHPCQGLCGEPCPNYCPVCLKQEGGIHSVKVVVKPCNHYSDVGPLDTYMKIEGNQCFQILEPRYCLRGCGRLIEQCPRYGNYIKRYLKLLKRRDYTDQLRWLYCKRGRCVFPIGKEEPLPEAHDCDSFVDAEPDISDDEEDDNGEADETYQEPDRLKNVDWIIEPTAEIRGNVFMAKVARKLKKFNRDT